MEALYNSKKNDYESRVDLIPLIIEKNNVGGDSSVGSRNG